MDLRTTQYYALDRGLDGMSLLDEAIPASLPEQSTLVPPQLRYPAQLQQLLNKPDLSEFLANAFVLATGNAVLSGPSQFAAALENAQQELHALLSDTAAPLAPGMGKTAQTPGEKSKAGDKSASGPDSKQKSARRSESNAALKSDEESGAVSAFEPNSASRAGRRSGSASGAASESIEESINEVEEAHDAAFRIKPNARRAYGSKSGERDTSDDVADRHADSTSASTSESTHARPPLSPRVERLVQRAGRVLERESVLRADLASYRAALLKG